MSTTPLTANPAQLGYVRAADGAPLYVAYHPASGKPGRPVVIAPPLFEERKSAYAPLHRLAHSLAAAGHAVLRFDYRGSGESGGDSAARRWADLAADLVTARESLAKFSQRDDIVLLGLRLGATLILQTTATPHPAFAALTSALSHKGRGSVIAVAPLISGAQQVRLWKMRSKIRAELTEAAAQTRNPKPAAGAVTTESRNPAVLDFDGYSVHPTFFDDIAAIDLLKDCRPSTHPALLVQVSPKTEATAENAKLAAALGPQAHLETLRMEPFWDKLDDVDTLPLETVVLNAVNEARDA